MTPLEPKPPDPSHPASYSLSWNLPCSSTPQYCQKLTDFYYSIAYTISSIDGRSGYSRCGSDAIHEPWCFFTLFWVSQLASFTGSANLDVNIVNLGLFFVPTFSYFFHFKIRVWVRVTTYTFVCCSVRVQARPSRLSHLKHPSCYWVEAVCRFNSVISPVAEASIQNQGIFHDDDDVAITISFGILFDLCLFPDMWADFAFYFPSLHFTTVDLGSCVVMLLGRIWFDILLFLFSPCYVSLGCQLQLCVKLCFDLNVDMDGARRVSWYGSYGVLPLNIKVEISNYDFPVAFLLDPE